MSCSFVPVTFIFSSRHFCFRSGTVKEVNTDLYLLNAVSASLLSVLIDAGAVRIRGLMQEVREKEGKNADLNYEATNATCICD